MTVEITPEPTPEEREAVLRALATLNGVVDRGGSSAWWRAGILEAVDEEPEEV
ncbi:MAG TPA: hypothetical protein VNN79_08880 [Actinomycetota bacterium]|nr:hypothetical protein [Actinomycetota bacterium]